jgi:hypothetical protein
MNITKLFEQQIQGGAKDNFFYGTEIEGTVRIERHRGTIDSLSLSGLEFDRMVGSTPFFRPCAYDEQGGEQGWAER